MPGGFGKPEADGAAGCEVGTASRDDSLSGAAPCGRYIDVARIRDGQFRGTAYAGKARTGRAVAGCAQRAVMESSALQRQQPAEAALRRRRFALAGSVSERIGI